MRQQGIAALSLPFGGGADHHSDLLALRVRFHSKLSFLCVAFGRMDTTFRHMARG
jgi:hypothetical protein